MSSTFRIGHRHLEEIRKNPCAWLASAGQGSRRRASYASLTREGIYYLHRTGDLDSSKQYLLRRLTNAHLQNPDRFQDAEFELVAYSSWLEQAGPGVGAYRRFRCDHLLVKDAVLGGEISRIDIEPNTDEYHAVLLGKPPNDWPAGFRFPLLQRVVAAAFKRPEGQVRLGVQNLDGSDMVLLPPFSGTEMDAAERTTRRLARRVLALLASGGGPA